MHTKYNNKIAKYDKWDHPKVMVSGEITPLPKMMHEKLLQNSTKPVKSFINEWN